jgi:glyoxylase-like metal-dependent hydrolase (beta-lactamase superfamily II)
MYFVSYEEAADGRTPVSELGYEVLVLDGVPRAGAQRLPSGESIVSSPLSVTLISGQRDAVLVDAPYTYGQVERVRDWIIDSGKRLRFVYITHGHGDHWFGVTELLDSLPASARSPEPAGTRVYATPGTLQVMAAQAASGRGQLWDKVFPGLIPPSPLTARPVPDSGLELEGHRLEPIELGHTDTDETTALWVPSAGLLIAGDAIYNGVHQYVLESADGGLDEWLTAIDTIESLYPRAVVAGHKAPGAADDPAIIGQTRQYLLDARHLLATATGPRDYYDAMVRRYPHRMNSGPVWYGAVALLGEGS